MAYMNHTNRIIVLIDMDCFFCQVEEKLNPALEGKPIAVVQYNAWKGGGIIAVNYPARDKGVTRHMRGDDAKKKCPEIVLCSVPVYRGKADLTKFRDAGKRVADVLQSFSSTLERASIDEAYLDITDAVNKKYDENFIPEDRDMKNTHVVGKDSIKEFVELVAQEKEYNESNYKLAIGGVIVEEMRAAVFQQTGYKCSAGIAHNKVLAKLVCGLHKPNQQTILPHEGVATLYENLPIRKIRSLGGKFGEQIVEDLGINTMGELSKFTEKELMKKFDDKTANWLYNIARGIDFEPVTTKIISKSIGCSKNFPGKSALLTQDDISHWVSELTLDLLERLQKDMKENNRKAKQTTIIYEQKVNKKEVRSSRVYPLGSYEHSRMTQNALDVLRKNCAKSDGSYHVTFLGFSSANFEDTKNVREITSFFKNMAKKSSENDSNNQPSTSKNAENISRKLDESGSNSDSNDGSISSIGSSIYSKTTEEDPTEYQNLVYYDEIYDQNINNSLIESNNKSHNSVDSINGEMLGAEESSNESIVLENKPPNSFFARYFNENSTSPSPSSAERNFDTSKVFDENSVESIDNSTTTDNLNNQIKENILIEETNEISSDGFTQICKECNKRISLQEFQSHMDYHYAIKIIKEEAHLYKTTSQNKTLDSIPKKTQNSPIKKNNNKKRKLPDSPGIRLFLNKKESTSENEVPCTECGRKLSVEEMESHMDYHVAKKLHLEINSNKSTTQTSASNETKTKIETSNLKKTKKDNAGKFKSISSFFKAL